MATKPVHTRATITGSGDLNMAFRLQAFKTPSTNLQAPEKIQSPRFNCTYFAIVNLTEAERNSKNPAG